MTQTAIPETTQPKISKTKELQDSLDNEISRAVHTHTILNGAVSAPIQHERYQGKTPDEVDAQISEDKKKLEQTAERLKLLQSARNLNVDIDKLEEMGFSVFLSLFDKTSKESFMTSDTLTTISFPEVVRLEASLNLGPKNHRCLTSIKLYLGQRKTQIQIGSYDAKECFAISRYILEDITSFKVHKFTDLFYALEICHPSHVQSKEYCFVLTKHKNYYSDAISIDVRVYQQKITK